MASIASPQTLAEWHVTELRRAVKVTRDCYDQALADGQSTAYQCGTLLPLLQTCERILGGES